MTLDKLLLKSICISITIRALMIYTAPCVMFLMRADTLFGQVGGGWALEIESVLGPVNWHGADRRVPFGGQKTREDSLNIPCATLKRRESWVISMYLWSNTWRNNVRSYLV
jgi:hypothetical protein